MNELLTINYREDKPTVSARELYEGLHIEERYSRWIERMIGYGFIQGMDYTPYQKVHPQNGQEFTDHEITFDMAKQICMLQRSEQGMRYRQNLIDLEKAWNTPEQIFARALKMAEKVIEQKDKLIIELQPKAEYFDELVERNLLTNFRDTAKELKVTQREFIDFLLGNKFVYYDSQEKLKPYADKNNGLFELKEYKSRYSDHAGLQTLITPKGRETFRLLISGTKDKL